MRDLVECDFPALWNHNGNAEVILRHGYSDGTYNYYELHDDQWYAIVPECGRAIADAWDLDVCIDRARDAHTQSNLRREIASGRFAKYQEEFEKLCWEAGIELQGNWSYRLGDPLAMLST